MSKLEVHVGGSFADTKRRVLDAATAAERGPVEGQTHIADSWTALSDAVVPERVEIRMRIQHQPAEPVAAAHDLGRDCMPMHGDVEAFLAANTPYHFLADIEALASSEED